MESKVCIVSNSKRNRSDDDVDDNRDSKHRRRHGSQDRYSSRDKYDKGSGHRYEELKVGDPYYSGGTLTSNRRDEDRYKYESKNRRQRRSKDRHEKENKSKNADNLKEEKIGAPYYSGGTAGVEHESGEESTDGDDDNEVRQRYYPTESADSHRKNKENFWNKYASKDKKQDVRNFKKLTCLK